MSCEKYVSRINFKLRIHIKLSFKIIIHVYENGLIISPIKLIVLISRIKNSERYKHLD